MRFEDFDILINKGFLNDTKKFDQYIAYGTIRGGMQQIHIRRRTERGCEATRKSFLNPVIEKIDNLNNV